jgi:OOP family OmpA-OmpF porin
MIKKLLAPMLLLGLAFTSLPVAAEDPVVTEVLDNRWFLTPQLGLIFSDDSDFDRGPGFGLSIGRPFNKRLAYEFTLSRQELETENAGDYERTSLSAQGLWFPFNSPFLDSGGRSHPYVLGGVQGASIDFLGESLSGYGPIAGFGLLQDFNRFSMRLDARYQLDDIDGSGVVPDETFYTWFASVGVHIPLGPKPQPPSYDDDGDGVPNNRDKCPNTPPGVKVGPDGCPLDSDGDGVPDTYDKCPNTPLGTKVNADGCPLDSDGDGVPDSIDKCPNTPRGVKVNADGCPLDSDGDGVPDSIDKCPNTLPGAKVDSTGCVVPQVIELRNVYFEYNKSRLTPESQTVLDRVADSLNSEPNVRVLLAGHTCDIGTDSYNQGLSEARANSVRQYLISKGVSGERMTSRGFGESEPAVPNTSEANRERNRRTEMRVLENGKPKP